MEKSTISTKRRGVAQTEFKEKGWRELKVGKRQ